jgi:hypothetical protein
MIADLVGVPDMQDTWGLRQDGWDCHSSRDVSEGKPKRTEAREPSMHVAESSEEEVEQPCAGERGGGKGEGVGGTQRRKRAIAAMISNQQRVNAVAGIPRGGSSKPRVSANRHRKVCVEVRAHRRTLYLRGGSVIGKRMSGTDDNQASQKSTAKYLNITGNQDGAGLQRMRPFLKSKGIGKQAEESISCAGVGQRKEKCSRQVLQLWLELSRCSGRFCEFIA